MTGYGICLYVDIIVIYNYGRVRFSELFADFSK